MAQGRRAKRTADKARRNGAVAGLGAAVLGAGLLIGAPHAALAGYATYVVDVDTGTVLHQRNARTPHYPASLTKMMTLYLVFEGLDRGAFNLKSVIPISKRAARQPASKLGLKAGESIMVNDAILALVTKSANDIATAIGEFVAGSESAFAARMTRRARELGMTNTTFRNASGLPNRRQRSTARDLNLLAQALYTDFPHYAHYFSVRRFTYHGRTYRNHNNLLGVYTGIDGVKTGYTRAAGYNLAASARRNGRHVIALILGAKTARRRDHQMRRLLDRAFAAIDRNDRLFAKVSRPKPKPDLAALRASPTVAANDDPGHHLARAAQSVGEALTNYVSISEALAYPDLSREWGVQLGAFARADAAERALATAAARFPKLLADTRRGISTVTDAHGTLYRARRIGLSEQEARKLCAVLKARREPCIVSPPIPPS